MHGVYEREELGEAFEACLELCPGFWLRRRIKRLDAVVEDGGKTNTF